MNGWFWGLDGHHVLYFPLYTTAWSPMMLGPKVQALSYLVPTKYGISALFADSFVRNTIFHQESSVYPRSKLLYLCPTTSHLLVGLAAHTLWAKTHLSIKTTCERFHFNGRHRHPVWCRKYIVKLYPRFDNSTTFERLAFLKIPLFLSSCFCKALLSPKFW